MLAVVAVIGLIVGGAVAVNAQIFDGEYPPIVERIAERFGLDEGEVQVFFDEVRTERHEKKKARVEERLDQAVADGVITEAQKDALVAKKAELREEKESLRGLEPEERRDAMQELRIEFKEWAEDSGIDLSEFRSGFSHRQGFGKKL